MDFLNIDRVVPFLLIPLAAGTIFTHQYCYRLYGSSANSQIASVIFGPLMVWLVTFSAIYTVLSLAVCVVFHFLSVLYVKKYSPKVRGSVSPGSR